MLRPILSEYALGLPLAVLVGLTTLAVPLANASAAAKPAAGSSQGEAEHAGEHHDEHDLSHANAGTMQEDPTEWRADLAIYTFAVFVLLFIILLKFAWGPISKALDERENRIAGEIAEAKRANEEAKQLLAAHQQKMEDASAEVRGMIDDAKKDAETVKQQIIDEAQTVAEKERERATREIEAAKTAALRELAQTSVDRAMDIAGKVVRREVKSDDHAELIKDALDNFPSRN